MDNININGTLFMNFNKKIKIKNSGKIEKFKNSNFSVFCFFAMLLSIKRMLEEWKFIQK